MFENQNEDLVCKITEEMCSKEFSTRLKFISLDKTIFEIELSSNTDRQLNDQICELVKVSLETATRTIISAK